MSAQPENPTAPERPAEVQPPTAPGVSQLPAAPLPGDVAPTDQPGLAGLIEARPELGVGAAFAGGFVVAMILKRLGR